MWGCDGKTPQSPRLCRAPTPRACPPQPVRLWTGCRGMGPQGRGGTADTGEPDPAFTPGRYCTRENVSTKDHMAPFCIEPLDKGVEGGRGSCQKAHFQGAPAPPTSDSRLAAPREWGHLFPLGWVPVTLLPSLPHGRRHRDSF